MQVFGRVFGTDRTGTGEVGEVREFFGTPGKDVPVARGVFRVGGRVKEVAAEGGGEGEDEGVACAEEVDGSGGVETLFGGGDDGDKVGVALRLHERDDAANRVHVRVEAGEVLCASGAEVGVEAALDGAGEHHGSFVWEAGGGSLNGGGHAVLCLLSGVVWFAEDVEDGADVCFDVALELDDLDGVEVDVAVDVALEGAGVGHDGAGEVEESVDAMV